MTQDTEALIGSLSVDGSELHWDLVSAKIAQEAATALRTLHAENASLREEVRILTASQAAETVEALSGDLMAAEQEIARLNAINSEIIRERDAMAREHRERLDRYDAALAEKDAAIRRQAELLPTLQAAERAVGRVEGLEAALSAAESVGRPVGAGDGCGTYIPGDSADAARAIRALLAEGDGRDR